MRTGCLVSICIALAGVLTAGQETATFSSGAELVVLHVTVRDQRGSLVSGLTERSFSVLEDGTRQSLSFFREQDTPVAVGLLIDSSGSMAQNRDRVVAAVAAFAEASHPDDEFFALAFNESVKPVIPTESRFTSDPFGPPRRARCRRRSLGQDRAVRRPLHRARRARPKPT